MSGGDFQSLGVESQVGGRTPEKQAPKARLVACLKGGIYGPGKVSGWALSPWGVDESQVGGAMGSRGGGAP